MEYTKNMVKRFRFGLLVLLVCFAVCSFAGCTSFYEEYFESFSSTDAFRSAEVTLTLPEGVIVESYFGEGYYVIKHYLYTENGTEIYSYGIATADYVIIAPLSESHPSTFFSGVIDIHGKVAIMAVKTLVNSTYVDRIGAVMLVGEGAYSDALVPYNFYLANYSDFQPIRLAGEYIAVLGDKDTALTISTLSVKYFTFYKLNPDSAKLEKAFVLSGNMFSTFEIFDHYLYAKHADSTATETSQSYYQISYYDLNKTTDTGYLYALEQYEPFSSSARSAFQTAAPNGQYDIYTYYMGGGIFMRAGIFKSVSAFTGYTMIVPDETAVYYAVMLSDRYSMPSGENYKNERLFPILVVNSYNDAEMRTIAASLNSSVYNKYDNTEEKKLIYDFPTYPISSMVVDGQSLVYYYYFPYAGNSNYSEADQVTAQVSFKIMDATLSGSHNFESLIMPTVFIDGVGFETNSPYFNALLGDLSAVTHSLNDKTVTLNEYVWNDAEKKTYETKVYHDRMAVVEEIDAINDTVRYGAYKYSLSKKRAKLAVPFIYSELTPFFDGYATGSVTNIDGSRTFYRVNTTGEQQQLANVYGLKNGVYIARAFADGRYVYALFANDGTPLLDYTATSMTLFEEFLTADGEYIQTTVIARQGGKDVFYRLGH